MTKDRGLVPTEGSGRVSQNAPGFVSIGDQHWTQALEDQRTREALDRGTADVEAGRVSPWSEVRKRLGI